MKKILLVFLIFVLGMGMGWVFVSWRINRGGLISPIGQIEEMPTPLYEYSLDKLREKEFTPKKIELVEKMGRGNGFESWLFKFETEEGWVSGMANIPVDEDTSNLMIQDVDDIRDKWREYPIIIMLRGYVDKEEYETGIGTRNAAAKFARNGFVTLAPDFLGYGSSDDGPQDELKSRFIRPATVLQLIANVEGDGQSATSAIFDSETDQIPSTLRDDTKVGLWGHSNGGQIALSVLELSNWVIPTVLWAPVSKPFPYSILYYTDQYDDLGKYLRQMISEFEKIYDVNKFSLSGYIGFINSPLQIHQGGEDEDVPQKWSDELVKSLLENAAVDDENIDYFVYPKADHNLQPSWEIATSRDIEFMKKWLNAGGKRVN